MEEYLVNKLIEANIKLSERVGRLEKENEDYRKELESLRPEKIDVQRALELREQLQNSFFTEKYKQENLVNRACRGKRL